MKILFYLIDENGNSYYIFASSIENAIKILKEKTENKATKIEEIASGNVFIEE